MRTVLLANNRLGVEIATYLASRGDLVGLIVHPDHEARHRAELVALGVPSWTWPDGLEDVRDLQPDCLLSVLFGHILSAAWLDVPSWLPLNLHPGLLPYNSGACPNVWPLVDGTPAGTTLHVMHAEVDSGPVLAQHEVPTYPDDTAYSLYRRLEAASLAMFESVWPDIRTCEPRPQAGGGTFHRLSELDTLDPSREELGLIDRLRARTFGPYGAEYEIDGVRYRARIHIERLN